MQNREQADTKFYWGNKIINAPEIPNILKAIEYYRDALFLLRSISREEAIKEDNKRIRDVLEALLQGLNKLLVSSSDWSQIVDELEKFLIFYVDSVKILNKTVFRLPGLDVLELKIGGPFTVLSSTAPSASQKERLSNYLAVITLFHGGIATEEDRKLESNDVIVKSSFALYQRALKALKATVKEDNPAEAKLPPSAAVPIPAAVPQSSLMRESKQVHRASAPSPASAPGVQRSSPQQRKRTQLRVFEYIAPDEPKREGIRKLVERGDYVKALAGYHRIMNHITNDHRCACDCQFMIGEEHSKNGRYPEAVSCFTEALEFYRHIRKDEIIEVDDANILKVFKAFLNTINLICKNWTINFEFSSKYLADFLNFYVGNFESLKAKSRSLPGLDGLNLDSLIESQCKITDAASAEKTRVDITIVRMFRQDTIPVFYDLMSMIDETKIKKEMWNNGLMSDTFSLFDKAFMLVTRIKGHPMLNPELNAATESKSKRNKTEAGSSSSSSMLGMK